MGTRAWKRISFDLDASHQRFTTLELSTHSLRCRSMAGTHVWETTRRGPLIESSVFRRGGWGRGRRYRLVMLVFGRIKHASPCPLSTTPGEVRESPPRVPHYRVYPAVGNHSTELLSIHYCFCAVRPRLVIGFCFFLFFSLDTIDSSRCQVNATKQHDRFIEGERNRLQVFLLLGIFPSSNLSHLLSRQDS